MPPNDAPPPEGPAIGNDDSTVQARPSETEADVRQSFGPYQILEEIARGGQGVVYRARHSSLGTLVAIKLLRAVDPTRLARFRQEARVLARLKHPHLLDVSDLGEIDGAPYLVMQYVAGENLRARVGSRGIPDFAWSATVMGAVARTLHFCHGQGVIHRDLKPANVLIETESETPIVADFGLIKRDAALFRLPEGETTELSASGEFKGTVAYMAPEQIDPNQFGPVGPWTDVYALGGTLYFLLTGRSPFPGTRTEQLLAKLVHDVPQDPAELNPDTPRPLAGLCMAALARDPKRRPHSAEAFADALQRASPGTDSSEAAARSATSSRVFSGLPWALGLILALGVLLLVLAVLAFPGPARLKLAVDCDSVQVWQAGNFLGYTGRGRALELELPLDTRELVLRRQGAEHRLSIELSAGHTLQRSVSLQVPISIAADPASRLSLWNQQRMLVSDAEGGLLREVPAPTAFRVPMGRYQLRLEAAGHHVLDTSLVVVPGPSSFRFELAPVVRWTKTVGHYIDDAPFIHDLDGDGVADLLVVARRNRGRGSLGQVLALSGRDGALLWQPPDTVNVFGRLLVQHDALRSEVVFATIAEQGPGRVVWLDAATGSPRHALRLAGAEGQSYGLVSINHETTEFMVLVGTHVLEPTIVFGVGRDREIAWTLTPADLDLRSGMATGRDLMSFDDDGDQIADGFLFGYGAELHALRLDPRGGMPTMGGSIPLRSLKGRFSARRATDETRALLFLGESRPGLDLLVLNADGTERWRDVDTVSRSYHGAHWMDIDQDGRCEIAFIRSTEGPVHELLILEAERGQVVARRELEQPPQGLAGFRRGGRFFLAVTTSDPTTGSSTVTLHDPGTLDGVWSHQLENCSGIRLLGADLDGDGADVLILCLFDQGIIQVVDPAFAWP